MTEPVLDPGVISDEDGEFYGVAGHVSAVDLARSVAKEFCLPLSDVIDPPTPSGLRIWVNCTTQGFWRVESRDDPSSWSASTRESVEELRQDHLKDGEDEESANSYSWPWEWDEVYTTCDRRDPGAEPATYWRAAGRPKTVDWCSRHDRRMKGVRGSGNWACEAFYEAGWIEDGDCHLELRLASSVEES